MSSVTEDIQMNLTQDNQEKLLRLLDENIRLKSIIHDVTEANKRWQKYNVERQGYVQKLLSTIKDLQQPEPDHTSAGSDPNADVLRTENATLRCELELSEQRQRHLAAKFETSCRDYREKLELLEIQAKMHRDDWEAEMREKNEAVKTVKKLQEAISRLNNKIFDLDQSTLKSTVYICTCPTFTNDVITCNVAELRQRKSPSSRDIQILPCQLLPKKSTNKVENFQAVQIKNLENGDSLDSSSTSSWEDAPSGSSLKESSSRCPPPTPSGDRRSTPLPLSRAPPTVTFIDDSYSCQTGSIERTVASPSGRYEQRTTPPVTPPGERGRELSCRQLAVLTSHWPDAASPACPTCRTRYANGDPASQFCRHVQDSWRFGGDLRVSK